MSPQIEKQQFRNNTQGWIGAVAIGPKGDERGIAVEPGGTVWLSEAEQILTANAPRRPEDNPFIEQTHIRQDPDTQANVEVKVVPLEPINEGRYVPANERPIPSDLVSGASLQSAATGDEPVVPVAAEPTAASREAEVVAAPGTRPNAPAVPPRAAAAAAAQDQTPEAAPEPPSAPEGESQPTFPTPAAPTPPAADPARTVPEDEGRAPQAQEETAVQSPGPASEETGAAIPPTGVAPQGEYQAGEEVGTPDAPATDASAPAPAEETGQQQPAPWTPGTEG